VSDQFTDARTGWIDDSGDAFRIGYHAPEWYHVEASGPGTQVLSLGGYEHSNATVETAVYVDSTDTETGRFRYGLVVRAHGADRAPLAGAGPERPENFFAFVIDPRAGKWQLIHEDTRPLLTLLEGDAPNLSGFDARSPDVLRLEMRGDQLDLFINGAWLVTYDTRGYHLTGDVGFFVETFDETKAHVHFESLDVGRL
jgi:hypothetical protein